MGGLTGGQPIMDKSMLLARCNNECKKKILFTMGITDIIVSHHGGHSGSMPYIIYLHGGNLKAYTPRRLHSSGDWGLISSILHRVSAKSNYLLNPDRKSLIRFLAGIKKVNINQTRQYMEHWDEQKERLGKLKVNLWKDGLSTM